MAAQGSKARRSHRGRWAAAALLLIAVAGVFFKWHQRQAIDAAPRAPTLVVLPLHAAGARHEEGVLAEGFSADLIKQLSRIDGLRVIGEASALRAASDHLGAQQLAERIGATALLEGQLHELGGDHLHVELRLSTAPDGSKAWTQTYDRKLVDLPPLTDEITRAVATALRLQPPTGKAGPLAVDSSLFREYLEARQLIDGPQRARGLDLLREVSAKAPNFAAAHATLARTLTNTLRGSGGGSSAELDEAVLEATRALELDPEQASAHTAQAVLACRTADWSRCMDTFARALALDPNDIEGRLTYSYWLAALGYVDRALRETEVAWSQDPLSYNANFARARLLDTVGRHDDAQRYLDVLNATSGGLVYARWHNAVWRRDYAAAALLVAAMPRSDGFRESYTVVTEALSEPRLWPQALPLIATSERANGGINVQRIMMPNPDYDIVITGLEKMLRDGWPSYYMLLWMPEYGALRRTPAFQDFLKRTRLLQYWRDRGFPQQCHADGDGAACN
jgi:TolB-like protein